MRVTPRHLLGSCARSVSLGCLMVAILSMACGSPVEMTDSRAEMADSSAEMAEYLMTLDLGTVDFPTSGSADAQRYFEQGVAALDTLAYHDAAILFREAQRVDSDFAMAYWGEAMTQTTERERYPGGRQHYDDAREVLDRLGPTPDARAAKAPTAREKAYLAAVEARYGAGSMSERERAYAEAMRTLTEQHPDDTQALALYGQVAGRVTGPGERGRAERDRILLEVLLRDPEQWHTIRSLIFRGDDAVGAPVGLVAVRRLADIAPDSHGSHHMPSHTFIDFGLWGEASRTSERALAMGREWMRTRGFDITEIDQVDDHTYGNHLFGYLQYSLLQEGRYADAKALVDQARTDYEDSGKAAAARVSLASTSARYLVETGRWDEASTLAETARTEGFWETPAVLLAVGIGAARTGDLALAREAEAGLEAAGAGAVLMAQEVSALIHLAEGDEATALRLLDAAAETTRAMPLPFGPAGPLKPVHELYGEVLLSLDRPGEAVAQFETGLARRPRRAAALLGAARAHALMGDAAAAGRYAELVDMWDAADSDHAGLQEARRYETP